MDESAYMEMVCHSPSFAYCATSVKFITPDAFFLIHNRLTHVSPLVLLSLTILHTGTILPSTPFPYNILSAHFLQVSPFGSVSSFVTIQDRTTKLKMAVSW